MASNQNSYYELVDLIYDNSRYVNIYHFGFLNISFLNMTEAFVYAQNLKKALTDSSEDDLSRLKRDFRPNNALEAIQKIIENLPSGEFRALSYLDIENARNDAEAKKFMRAYDQYQEVINMQALIVLETLRGNSRSQAELDVGKASNFSFGDDLSELIVNQNLPKPKQSQETQKQEESSCFVVTATYGTPHAKEVVKYRSFRDNYLRKFFLGRVFIRIYASIGPSLALLVERNTYLKSTLSFMLGQLSVLLPDNSEDI